MQALGYQEGMRIDALHIEGLRHAPDWTAEDLGRRVDLPVAPAGIAVADALALLAAGLDAERTESILARAGLAGKELEALLDDREMPEQVSGLLPAEVEALLDPEGGRRVVISAKLALDPPLFGQLREESMRDPRMLSALGEDPTVSLKVGWLFTHDFETTSVGILELKVASSPFPTGRNERPRWMDGLLRSIGTRIGGVGARGGASRLGEVLLNAALSADPSVRTRYARLVQTLAGPPFDLGRLELVGRSPMPCFGPDLVRARQMGPRSVRALRVASAALVDAPDVLVVEDGVAARWGGWLESLTHGDDATLEQVFLLTEPD